MGDVNCPCCGSGDLTPPKRWDGNHETYGCRSCGCEWNESRRAAWTARAGRGEGAVAWSRSRTINNAEGYAIGTDEPELAWGKEPPDDAGWSPLYTSPPARREVESGGTPVVCPQCQGRNIVQSSERLYHFGCIDCAYEWDVTMVAHRSPSEREALADRAMSDAEANYDRGLRRGLASKFDYQSLVQAISRGWCHAANAGKEMDPALVFAIANEVNKLNTTGEVKG